MRQLILWTGVCITAIPALAGCVVGGLALFAIVFAATVLMILAVLIGCIGLAPLVIWCCIMDRKDVHDLKTFAAQGVEVN